MVGQLTKEQSRKDYGKSFKNYHDYLSELNEKEAAQAKVCAAKAKSDNLDKAGARYSRDPSASDADRATAQTEALRVNLYVTRVESQTESPTPKFKPCTANLNLLDDLKALQIRIWSIIMQAQQTVIEDLIEKPTCTKPVTCHDNEISASSHGPYRCHPSRANHHQGCAYQHKICTPQRWTLRLDPPDPPSTNQ